MDDGEDVRIVMCAPGFPASLHDSDKPFLLDHARALIAAGFQVTVICPANANLPAYQNVEGIEVVRVRYAPRKFETLASTGSMYREARGLRLIWVPFMILSLIFATIRKVRKGSDLIYGHWWIPGGLVAVVSASLTRRPSLVHLHGSDAEISKTKAMRFCANWVLRRADRCLAVSDPLVIWGEGISGREIDLLPMPVRLHEPLKFSVSKDQLVLGVGRLVHEKGFDVLLDGVAKVRAEIRPKVAIVGAGPERQALLDRAKLNGVDLQLPGSVSPQELVEWYRRATVVVVPSRREGFGLVAAEAAAVGRAVIGTAVGGIPSVVEDRVNGLIVDPGNSDAIGKALKEIDPAWGAKGPARVSHLSSKEHGAFVRRMCEDLCK